MNNKILMPCASLLFMLFSCSTDTIESDFKQSLINQNGKNLNLSNSIMDFESDEQGSVLIDDKCGGFGSVPPVLLDPLFKSSSYFSGMPMSWGIGNTHQNGDLAHEIENTLKMHGRTNGSPNYMPWANFMINDNFPNNFQHLTSSFQEVFFEEGPSILNTTGIGPMFLHRFLISNTDSNDAYLVSRDLLSKLKAYKDNLPLVSNRLFFIYDIEVNGEAFLCTNSSTHYLYVNFKVGYVSI